MFRRARLFALPVVLAACAPTYDVVIRHGTVYDGTGGVPAQADVAIRGDSIVAVGGAVRARGRTEIDAAGLAVAPGFINMLSWATESLIEDGRGLSDLLQGVTLEVFGEGSSMGPLNDSMKVLAVREQSDVRYPVTWTTLGEYLEHLERRGVSPNVASFIGATTVRVHEIGFADRPPSPAELERMRALVRQAMAEGALGVGSSLIYAPAFYARTDELVALAEEAGRYGGMYISHLRSEGNRLLEAVDELITIARRARVPAEIYHLKAAGGGELGQARFGDRSGGARPRRGAAHHRGHVHLHRGCDGTRRGDAALGAGGWARGLAPPAPGARDPCPGGARDAHPDERVGEPVSGRGLARQRAAGGLQAGLAQAADR